MIYTNVSFVGSTALAEELMPLGPRYGSRVIVTQVVPAIDSYATTILKYKSALAKFFPGDMPDYVPLDPPIWEASGPHNGDLKAGAD